MDARAGVAALSAGLLDGVVCDPPYALKFMGKKWDTGEVAHDRRFWRDVMRACKPGAHLVAFAGSRTYHRLACAIEDAGWEIRDEIDYLHDTQFAARVFIESLSEEQRRALLKLIEESAFGGMLDWIYGSGMPKGPSVALKPAKEPMVLARKPFDGTLADCVRVHGTGLLNIDECRVDPTGEALGGGIVSARTEGWDRPYKADPGARAAAIERGKSAIAKAETLGRYPANIVHDGSAEVLTAFPPAPGQLAPASTRAAAAKTRRVYAPMARVGEASANNANDGAVDFKMRPGARRLDSGSAARFFYCAKAGADDRVDSRHPTIKPLALMRWLVRLVVPAGGLLLDPFAGTGTTGGAALLEGRRAILIEREAEYVADMRRRIDGLSAQSSLFDMAGDA